MSVNPGTMALLDSLFGKKKKTFKATCPITKEPIEHGFGYLLTTSQVIASRRYWDLVMTEPETLSYTVSHFNNQPSGTQMRSMIFQKFSSVNKPWVVSDSIISYFDVDKKDARAKAQQWWESEGQFVPQQDQLPVLDDSTFTEVKNYAILEAGRQRVAGQSRM